MRRGGRNDRGGHERSEIIEKNSADAVGGRVGEGKRATALIWPGTEENMMIEGGAENGSPPQRLATHFAGVGGIERRETKGRRSSPFRPLSNRHIVKWSKRI